MDDSFPDIPKSEEMLMDATAHVQAGMELGRTDLVEEGISLNRQAHYRMLTEVAGMPPMHDGESFTEYVMRLRQEQGGLDG